jgi:hypothetical protein
VRHEDVQVARPELVELGRSGDEVVGVERVLRDDRVVQRCVLDLVAGPRTVVLLDVVARLGGMTRRERREEGGDCDQVLFHGRRSCFRWVRGAFLLSVRINANP